MSSQWEEWVERNAKPKIKYMVPSISQSPTRWQKSGPMNRKQWIEFHKWASVNAVPIQQLRKIAKSKPKPAAKRSAVSPFLYFCVASKLQAKKAKNTELMENLRRLSQPKNLTVKYTGPLEKDFSYRPSLCGAPPPRAERGRPSNKPVVPCCFQHDDVQSDFWSQLRFEISKKALKAVASPKIVKLAQPRQYPPKPHCPLPPTVVEKIPKRRKMSASQWRDHLHRLDYLSQPNHRVLAELQFNNIRL